MQPPNLPPLKPPPGLPGLPSLPVGLPGRGRGLLHMTNLIAFGIWFLTVILTTVGTRRILAASLSLGAQKQINTNLWLWIAVLVLPLAFKIVTLAAQIWAQEGLLKTICRVTDWIMNLIVVYWLLCVETSVFPNIQKALVTIIASINIASFVEGIVLLVMAVALAELAALLFKS